jgi:hypothetical protein
VQSLQRAAPIGQHFFAVSKAPEAHQAHYNLGCAHKGCSVQLSADTVDRLRHESIARMSQQEIVLLGRSFCKEHRQLQGESFLWRRIHRGTYHSIKALSVQSTLELGDTGFSVFELARIASAFPHFQVFKIEKGTFIGRDLPPKALKRIGAISGSIHDEREIVWDQESEDLMEISEYVKLFLIVLG